MRHPVRSRLTPALLAASALVTALSSCGDPRPDVDRNLLIVSVDTLRADRLGAYGNREWDRTPSPVADGLAADGVLFEMAYAPRGQTHPSIASMLTGKYPITTGVRENGFPLDPRHRTLVERLQEAGWQTGVFIANFEVGNENDAWVARGADVAADGYGGNRPQEWRNESRFQKTWDDRVEAAALAYLDQIDPDRPFAMWVHFYDVHKPYNPPQEHVDAYGAGPDVPPALAAPGPDSGQELERHLATITLSQRPVPASELARIRGLYDGGVSAADARLGRLIDALAERGELQNTYVLFTSDHGEELYDHNRYFFHGASIYDGVVRIPLVVQGPDLRKGARVPAHVQNIDIAPTILDLFDLPPDPEMEGHSLAPLLRGEADAAPAPYAFVEWQDLIYAVTDGRYKLIYNPDHRHTRKAPYVFQGVPTELGFAIDCLEGYDLSQDPLEQVNLLADVDLADLQGGAGLPPEFQPLYQALLRWLADPEHQGGMAGDGLGQEQMERMRQLGYLGTGSRKDSVRKEPCLHD